MNYHRQLTLIAAYKRKDPVNARASSDTTGSARLKCQFLQVTGDVGEREIQNRFTIAAKIATALSRCVLW